MTAVIDYSPGDTAVDASIRRVLNAGSGPYSPTKLHRLFSDATWREIRLDIDSRANPDMVASVTNMREVVTDASFDAIWSSHNLEHLYAHEVPVALAEFRRVLKADGFALIATPDLETVARLIVDSGLETIAYTSPAGPITPLDMLYGHSPSIGRGNTFMAHKTGYTCDRLGRLIVEAGFAEALVTNASPFELLAIALMPMADRGRLVADLRGHGVDFSA